MSETRITARLDEQTAEDLQFLRQSLGEVSITQALKHAVHSAAREIRDRQRARRQKQLWRDSGFAGGFSGPEDLSANYKHYLAERLEEKHAAKERPDR